MPWEEVGENWNCPYCGHAQVLSGRRYDQERARLAVEGAKDEAAFAIGYRSIVCANNKCRELSLAVRLLALLKDAQSSEFGLPLHEWTLLPPSSAKPQPAFIPQVIRDDYYEACAIRDLSPKASATLTRRCLQGMIRDFCKISRARLIDEINELRKQVLSDHPPHGVLPDTIDAIDDVRKIGNIGAHMEADINVIVDVDAGEAQKLIELVEALFLEWYVAAEDRKNRLAQLRLIADEKKQKQKDK
jgi:hypothetical protein